MSTLVNDAYKKLTVTRDKKGVHVKLNDSPSLLIYTECLQEAIFRLMKEGQGMIIENSTFVCFDEMSNGVQVKLTNGGRVWKATFDRQMLIDFAESFNE